MMLVRCRIAVFDADVFSYSRAFVIGSLLFVTARRNYYVLLLLPKTSSVATTPAYYKDVYVFDAKKSSGQLTGSETDRGFTVAPQHGNWDRPQQGHGLEDYFAQKVTRNQPIEPVVK
ncbi:hypothetical protein ColLi_11481 [Colletotrichum liriopes]|uniref:Uncharacterized protein n=1 Tax=Colletotrichum liriopes TaxID=708192 RepID=A0AA37GZ06_9PEZI|nr:hypothetical protein ColLi_11481 [Colletotrichum liriopes]